MIADADLDALMNQCRIELPGASDMAIKNQLWDVINEFFGDSSSWTETISLPVLTTTQDYTLIPAQDGQIIRLFGVLDSNNVTIPATMPDVGTLHLQNAPNNAQNYQVVVAKNIVRPNAKNNIPIAPDWLLPLYSRYIQYGVIGYMMMQPNKPYSNTTIGTFKLRKFRDGISVARIATMRRNLVGGQAWRYPQGFRTRNQRGGVSVGPNLGF